MMSSNTSEPERGVGVLRTGAAGRGRATAVPLWPGMIPASGTLPAAPRTLPSPPKRKRKRRPPPRKSRGRSLLVGSAAVGGSLAAVAVVLVYTSAGAPPPRQAATAADPVLGGGPGCEATRTDQLVRGNGTGSTASGPDVILAFQHAYYVSRSGLAARTLTTYDAAVPSAEVIGSGIASVPAGTQHCVLITPLPDGRFDVVITEARPDAPVRTYRQFVTVTTSGGVVSISKIAAPS